MGVGWYGGRRHFGQPLKGADALSAGSSTVRWTASRDWPDGTYEFVRTRDTEAGADHQLEKDRVFCCPSPRCPELSVVCVSAYGCTLHGRHRPDCMVSDRPSSSPCAAATLPINGDADDHEGRGLAMGYLLTVAIAAVVIPTRRVRRRIHLVQAVRVAVPRVRRAQHGGGLLPASNVCRRSPLTESPPRMTGLDARSLGDPDLERPAPARGYECPSGGVSNFGGRDIGWVTPRHPHSGDQRRRPALRRGPRGHHGRPAGSARRAFGVLARWGVVACWPATTT